MDARWMPELHFECSSWWSAEGSGMHPSDPDERSENTQMDSGFATQKNKPVNCSKHLLAIDRQGDPAAWGWCMDNPSAYTQTCSM